MAEYFDVPPGIEFASDGISYEIVGSLGAVAEEAMAAADGPLVELRWPSSRPRSNWPVAVVLHDLNLAGAWADKLIVLKSGRVLARGAPAAVFNDALLSEAYGCPIRTNATPAPGAPYLLPHLLRLLPHAARRDRRTFPSLLS